MNLANLIWYGTAGVVLIAVATKTDLFKNLLGKKSGWDAPPFDGENIPDFVWQYDGDDFDDYDNNGYGPGGPMGGGPGMGGPMGGGGGPGGPFGGGPMMGGGGGPGGPS